MRHKPKRRKILIVLTKVLFFGLLLANVYFVNRLGKNRVSSILANDPTRETVGTITKIESRTSGKFGTTTNEYAILTYSTADKTIHVGIINNENQFAVGQKFKIEYSIGHPEMFQWK